MSGCNHDDDRLPGPTYCPYCGDLPDRATVPFEQGATARRGDVNVCMSCGEVSLFDEHMLLRRPTMAEFVRIMAVSGDQIRLVQEAIAATKLKLGRIRSQPAKN